MAAKIKKPAGHNYNPFKHKPRNVHPKAFEKVYWPYLPLLLVLVVGVALALQPKSFSRLFHPGGQVLSYAAEMSRDSLLNDTNQLRARDNLADLRLNAKLNKAAQAKAEDMARRDYWSHNTPDGAAPWSFVVSKHYQYQKLGENLAAGFGDSDAVINAWYASTSHRHNLLDSNYSDVGFGYANIANYKAAGGGPMTVVVAMYGQPAGQPAVAAAPTNNPPATTESSLSGLDQRTTRGELTFAKTRFAPVAASLIAIGLVGGLGAWLTRHFIGLRRAWLRSERFVIRHPAVDLFFIAVIVLSYILSQTAGFIQ